MKYIVDLKHLRNKEGLKQAYLAKKMKISESYLSQLENYERRVSLDDFLNALDILGYEFVVRKKGEGKMEVVKNILNENTESIEDIKEYALKENNESIISKDESNKEYCDIIKKVTHKLSDIDFLNYEKYKFIFEEAIKVSNELEFMNVSQFLEEFRLNCENGVFQNVSVRSELESIYYITKYKNEFYEELDLFIECIKSEVENIDTELELEDRNKKIHDVMFKKSNEIASRIIYDYEKYKFIFEEAIKVSNELEFMNVSQFLERFRLNCENGVFQNVSVRSELESIYYITKYKNQFYEELDLFIEYIKSELENIDTELELKDRNKKIHDIMFKKANEIASRIIYEWLCFKIILKLA